MNLKGISKTTSSRKDKKRPMKFAAAKPASQTFISGNSEKRSKKSIATKTTSITPNSINRPSKAAAAKATSETPSSGNNENLSAKSPPEATSETPSSENDENLSAKSAPTKESSEIPSSGNEENLSMKSNLNETPVSSKPNKGAYKLSLCKSTAETMTRKRILYQQSKSLIQPKRLKLELKQNEISTEETNSETQNENCDTKPSDECDQTSKENDSPSDSSLQKEVDELKKTIATSAKFEQRSAELKGLITKWQEAGVTATKELSEKLQPPQDEQAILAHFHIDPALFKMNFSD